MSINMSQIDNKKYTYIIVLSFKTFDRSCLSVRAVERGGGKTVKPYQAPSLKKAPGIVLHTPPPPKILKAPQEFFKGEGPLLALESTDLKKIACGRPFYLT